MIPGLLHSVSRSYLLATDRFLYQFFSELPCGGTCFSNISVNTQNCHIWTKKDPQMDHEIPLHSPKVTSWCGCMGHSSISHFFFEKINLSCPVTAGWYHGMLKTFVVPQLQQRHCLTTTIFIQGGAAPYVAWSVEARFCYNISRMSVLFVPYFIAFV
ncbi:hypothetical protein AVEN_11894-1 [Araneus ventricosus]|uniref:Uncharacterized protein n=1 Tax=Araneus ventricosus TaxID=182803 RepID=A0A4Y2ES81_ARAVE|nr:hypothetical protein AVEN_11894-1 [Araneus ventricosus]